MCSRLEVWYLCIFFDWVVAYYREAEVLASKQGEPGSAKQLHHDIRYCDLRVVIPTYRSEILELEVYSKGRNKN